MKADEYLDREDIDYMLVEQEQATRQCKDSADERGVSERQIVKSLLVRQGDTCLHCLIPGDRHLDKDAFESAVELLPEHEVKRLTGFEPGTVHPFASDCRLIIDNRIRKQEKVSFTTGNPSQGIIISPENLFKAFRRDFEAKDISSKELSDAERYANEQGIEPNEAKDILRNDDERLFEALSDRFDEETASTYVRFKQRAAEAEENPVDISLEDLITVIAESSSEDQTKSGIVALLRGEEPTLEDEVDLDAVLDAVIEANKEAVEDYRAGKDDVLNYLIGQVMQQSNGVAEPEEARKRLMERL